MAAEIFCQPVLHTSCKLCVSCTVQENTVQIHHPVLHIALTCFCNDALDYILSTVRWILGNATAAFLKNVGERCGCISQNPPDRGEYVIKRIVAEARQSDMQNWMMDLNRVLLDCSGYTELKPVRTIQGRVNQ